MPSPLFTGSLTGGTVSQLSAPIAVADGGTGTTTPSLIAGAGVSSITGAWPNQTINVSAGGGGGVSSLNSLTGALSIAAGSNITVTPSGSNVTVAATLNPASGYDAVILAEGSLTHYYKGLETHSASSMSDAVGSQALTLNGNCRAGELPIVRDGSASVFCMGGPANSDYVSFPVNTFLPASAASFSVEFWFRPSSPQIPNGVMFDASPGKLLTMFQGISSAFSLYLNNAGAAPNTLYIPPSLGTHWVYTWDGTNSTVYFNGFQYYQAAVAPGFTNTGTGYFFLRADLTQPLMGYIHKPARYNAALTGAKVLAHYAAGVPTL